MKKVLVTGANGQLGRAINIIVKNYSDIDLINTDFNIDGITSLNICDENEVISFVDKIKPNIIINCAAYTDVNRCESEEEKAYIINAIGAKNLAIASKNVNAKLVHVSTDYVFDGNKTTPYIEEDETNPQSAYGRTKLQGEKFVQQFADKYFIVRTAWLYGDGNNFVKTMLKIAKNPEVKVVGDQFGTPTSAIELAKMIFVIMNSEEFGIYHATCEGSTSWYDFAKEIFKLANLNVNLLKITTSEYPTPAVRPKYSVLENKHLNSKFDYKMADWDLALKEFMKGNTIL